MSRNRLKRALRDAATFIDQRAAGVGLRFERPALISFLFHAVFDSQDEIDRDLIHPQEAITKEAFKRFIDHFSSAGYRFVSLADVERGLEAPGYYACVTFDDGYANNTRILEYGLRVDELRREGEAVLVDAVYCERRRRGSKDEAIEQEIELLKGQKPEVIEGYLVREFGADVNSPRTDLDRPLSQQELKELASHESITIGNHTMDHAILTSLSPAEIRDQLMGAQQYLEDVVGTRVSAISYPNGNYDNTVLEIARDVGFSCGITTVRRKDPVPLARDRLLELGRFQFEASRDLDAQMRVMRSELQFANAARRLRGRLR